MPPRNSKQAGNIFFALFGAIALVGLLGAGVVTFMKGPLASAVKITRQNTAEAQMSIAGQVAVMAAANAANAGDCDLDGYVEPLEWRDRGSLPAPTGGGLVPNSIGISKKDPWGTEYGYCVWDHGPAALSGPCELSLPGTDRRAEGANSRIYPVVAIVSAGPDKTFTTTCRNFSTGADRADQNNNGVLTDAGDRELVGKTNPTDDDIIFTYSYEEATGASGGLWQLKSSDPTKATITKDLEVTGGATFQGTGTFQRLAATGSDFLDVLSGIRLPTSATMPTCNLANQGVMRRNVSGTGIEICSAGNVWAPNTGTGSAKSFDPSATCTAPADAGKVRYNNVALQPEFCNGTAWIPFALSAPTAGLAVSPGSDYSMNITGPCIGGDCPFAYSTWRTFTVRNTGNTVTSTLGMPSLTGANAASFEFDLPASTCDNGIPLQAAGQAGNSCVMVVRARASMNGPLSANLNFTAGALSAVVPLYGAASSFGCSPGAFVGGGILTDTGSCSGSNPTTGSIILQPAGCGCTTNNPTCSNSPSSDCLRLGRSVDDWWQNTAGNGPQNSANMLSPYILGSPAAQYCDQLVLNGYEDWYLGSISEYLSIALDSLTSTVFQSQYYYTSSNTGNQTLNQMSIIDGGNASITLTGGGTTSYPVRCLRRHATLLPTAQTDTNPNYPMNTQDYIGGATLAVTLYANTASSLITSSSINVRGINASSAFSVSGAGSPTVSVNSGAFNSSGTINPGDSIRIQITSPAAGANHIGSVLIGTDESPINVTVWTLTPGKTVRMFVSSSTFASCNMSGVAGADATCVSDAGAAGLASSGTYRALLSTSSVIARNRIAADVSRFETVPAGTFIASSLTDLSDGSIATPITTPSGGLPAGFIWTNTDIDLTNTSISATCTSWTSGSVTAVSTGIVGSITAGWVYGATTSGTTSGGRIICYGPN